jgi:hypothetical protein
MHPSRHTSAIPDVFHFIWGLGSRKTRQEPFPLFAYVAIASCVAVNNPRRTLLHCPEPPSGEWGRKALALAEPVFLETPRALFGKPVTHHAHRADVARLNILNRHGGVYADLDTLFVNPLPASLFNKPFVMGRQGADGLCNAFMMAAPGSEFGRTWLAAHEEHFTGGGPDTPGWCVHSVQLPNSLSRRMPEAVHIEPQRSFFKHLYDEAGLAALFDQLDPDMEGVYSLHLWHTLSRERLEAMTPDSIRSDARERRSTYAVQTSRLFSTSRPEVKL